MSDTPTSPSPVVALDAVVPDRASHTADEHPSAAGESGPAEAVAESAVVEGPVAEGEAAATSGPMSGAATDAGQTSLSPSAPPVPVPVRALTYAVDIVFCIDVTGSMTPILDTVKQNALRFYADVQANLVNKGKNVDDLRVRVVAFRDFAADGAAAMQESPFFELPTHQEGFSTFVNGLVPEGGGDAPESGLEAVSIAMASPWTTLGDRRRQVIVVWTDQPAQPLGTASLPGEYRDRVPSDFSTLTDMWEDAQGVLGSSSKRLILFAPDGPGWSDISSVWENVVHNPSQAGGGLSDVDYGTIIDSIGNSV